ncbi:MAG: hypothetical protein QM722_21665 [Piscinibacter sp.]
MATFMVSAARISVRVRPASQPSRRAISKATSEQCTEWASA